MTTATAADVEVGAPPAGLLALIRSDLAAKSAWLYEGSGRRLLLKTLLTDGTTAMLVYRLMQWSRRHRLPILEMICNKINVVGCRCIIGRGAEFGPAFVLVHADGVVINGAVRGGRGVTIEHQVTVGAEGRESPTLGDGVFLGAGCKVVGAVRVGDHARVGANAVVIADVPPHATAVGVPARVIRRAPPPTEGAP